MDPLIIELSHTAISLARSSDSIDDIVVEVGKVWPGASPKELRRAAIYATTAPEALEDVVILRLQAVAASLR